MANLFNLLKPQAKLPRNGFDLSQRHLFTASAGELLPICPIDCVPGDHHEINVLEMARTTKVHTDAFVRMKQHFEFYFVPYTQLWNSFNEFVDTRLDGFSTELSPSMESVPYIDLEHLLRTMYDIYTTSQYGENRHTQWLWPALKILDLLGYGAYYDLDWSAADSQDFYSSIVYTLSANKNIKVNLFRLLSYQKIFADYYRNSVYDNLLPIAPTQSGNIAKSYTWSYNLDRFKKGQNPYMIAHDSDFDDCLFWYLMPHYRQWKKDMFTGLYPDTQFGAVSVAPLDPDFILNASPNNVANQFKTIGQSALSSSQDGKRVIISSTPDTTFTANTGVSVLNLLKAEALQKWRQSTMLAGSRVNDQFEAHYGVKPRFHNDTMCQFVGAFDSFIGLQEVVATNEQTGNTLGEIGAHGVGTANGKITFDCHDFGTLLCIYSVVPESDYNARGLDKQNANLEHFDFWTPEFQNLGLVPVTRAHQDLFPAIHTTDPDVNPQANYVLGYAPRYYEYKSAVDKVHGRFMSFNGGGLEAFSHWVAPRFTRNDNPVTIPSGYGTLGSLYIDPRVLDPVFVTSYDGLPENDQFLINSNFDIKSVRNMSVQGLPQF